MGVLKKAVSSATTYESMLKSGDYASTLCDKDKLAQLLAGMGELKKAVSFATYEGMLKGGGYVVIISTADTLMMLLSGLEVYRSMLEERQISHEYQTLLLERRLANSEHGHLLVELWKTAKVETETLAALTGITCITEMVAVTFRESHDLLTWCNKDVVLCDNDAKRQATNTAKQIAIDTTKKVKKTKKENKFEVGRIFEVTNALISGMIEGVVDTPPDMPIPTEISTTFITRIMNKSLPKCWRWQGLTTHYKGVVLATRWSNIRDSLKTTDGIESILAPYESEGESKRDTLRGSLQALSERLSEDAVKTSQLVPAAAGGGQGDKANAVESKSESESDECLFGHGDEQEDTVEMEGSTLRPPKRGREDDENGELGDGAGRVAKIARRC
jgi:hypothetical protein